MNSKEYREIFDRLFSEKPEHPAISIAKPLVEQKAALSPKEREDLEKKLWKATHKDYRSDRPTGFGAGIIPPFKTFGRSVMLTFDKATDEELMKVAKDIL